ncbi:MAG: hypothetical protein ACI9OJ_003626 [Myxococcota bacterium]|jgi:hypothetical protein
MTTTIKRFLGVSLVLGAAALLAASFMGNQSKQLNAPVSSQPGSETLKRTLAAISNTARSGRYRMTLEVDTRVQLPDRNLGQTLAGSLSVAGTIRLTQTATGFLLAVDSVETATRSISTMHFELDEPSGLARRGLGPVLGVRFGRCEPRVRRNCASSRERTRRRVGRSDNSRPDPAGTDCGPLLTDGRHHPPTVPVVRLGGWRPVVYRRDQSEGALHNERLARWRSIEDAS